MINPMKTNKLNRPLFIALITFCIIFAVYMAYSYLTRCPENGLSKLEAEKVANKLMPIHFVGDFTLTSQSFDEKKKEWSIQYEQKKGSCKVDCIVDRCGAFDVAGITADCESRP